MSKKYLSKNEFRMDLNPDHFGENKKPHPAYITAKQGNSFKANGITHSRSIKNSVSTCDVFENPNKTNRKVEDKRKVRITPPYWQHKNLFSDNTLDDFRFSNRTRKQIKNYNKKFDK